MHVARLQKNWPKLNELAKIYASVKHVGWIKYPPIKKTLLIRDALFAFTSIRKPWTFLIYNYVPKILGQRRLWLHKATNPFGGALAGDVIKNINN
jgi:hypothetical protein